MKVGMIFECGPMGADIQVCEHLAGRCAPGTELAPSVTLDRKPRLIRECGAAAANLLEDGCDRVLIIWDLYPAWREHGERPCRKEDREAIFQSLAAANVDGDRVALICIEEELEAWLIADGRAVSSVLSRPSHQVVVKDVKRPDRTKNPKKVLTRVFREHRGFPYSDLQHAIQIVRALPDLTRLHRIPTFARFHAMMS